MSAPEDKKPKLALYAAGLVFVMLAVILLITEALIYLTSPFHPLWFFLSLLFACVAALITHAVLSKASVPLEKSLERMERMAKGERIGANAEPLPTSTIKEFNQLAEDVDGVNRVLHATRAEAVAEGQRQSQFVSDVAHELRTPLTAMRGAAETLMDEDISFEDREHFATTIVGECNRLTRLANDLIALHRIEEQNASNLKRVDLHTVVEHVADVLEPINEDRGVVLTISGEAPDVLGDPDRLQQVVVNLVENASRYAATNETGGRVHVELSGVKKHSVITVADNGPGFGDVDPARLFDRFYRGDFSRARTQGGLGLGLAIVKAIVTSYDGTVEAVNIPSGGACFIVAFPSLPPVDEQ